MNTGRILLICFLCAVIARAQVKEDRVVASVDPVTEAKLGRIWADHVLKKYRISKDPKYVEPVQRVAYRILSAINDRPDLEDWNFLVVEESRINAFAMPGGYVAVYTGLLDLITEQGRLDEEMLAGVLGHEIAHVVLRHSIEGLKEDASLNWVLDHLDQIDQGSLSGALTEDAEAKFRAVTQARFTRIQEFEADAQGAFYAALAGYGYSGSTRYTEKIMAVLGEFQPSEYLDLKRKDGSYSAASHPTDRDRIEHMNRYRKDLLNLAGEFNWGYELLKSGKYDKAIVCFKDVARIFPKSFQVWNNLGTAHHRKFLDLRKPGPGVFQTSLTDYFVNLRELLREPDLLNKAIEYYRQALHLNRHALGVKNNLALALAQTGNEDDLIEAEELLQSLLAKEPNNPQFINHYGILLYTKWKREDLKSVEEQFRKASAVHLPALYNLALVQIEMGKLQGLSTMREYLNKEGQSSWAESIRQILTERGAQIETEKSPMTIPREVLQVKLGERLESVTQKLGQPESILPVTTSRDDWGQLVSYETSGISFILSEGRIISIRLNEPARNIYEDIPDSNKVKAVLPEFMGIEIGDDEEKIVLILGESSQVSEDGFLEKTLAYGDGSTRLEIVTFISRVTSMTLRDR